MDQLAVLLDCSKVNVESWKCTWMVFDADPKCSSSVVLVLLRHLDCWLWISLEQCQHIPIDVYSVLVDVIVGWVVNCHVLDQLIVACKPLSNQLSLKR